MELIKLMQERRSVRQYTGEPIPQESLQTILRAGLLSPSGHNFRPWELIVVKNPATLKKLAQSRTSGAAMLEHAAAAIVVIGDSECSDVWTEDCSIVMASMHLMASSLGVGSCWIQGRLREASDGRTTEEYVRELLQFPERFRLEAILSLGMPASVPAAHRLEDLPTEKIHQETMNARLHVDVRYTLKPGTRDEFLQKFRDIRAAECSRAEEGNLRYEAFCPEDSEDDVCLIEEWANAEVQKKHGTTPHYAKLTELKQQYVTHVELIKSYVD